MRGEKEEHAVAERARGVLRGFARVTLFLAELCGLPPRRAREVNLTLTPGAVYKRPRGLRIPDLSTPNPKTLNIFLFSLFLFPSSSAGRSFWRAEQRSSSEQQEAEQYRVRAESSELGFDATESRSRVGPS